MDYNEKKEWVIRGTIGAVSLSLGAVAGYFYAKKRSEIEYEVVETEIVSEPGNEQLMMDFNERVDKAFEEIRALREDVFSDSKEEQHHDEATIQEKPVKEPVEVNVFPTEDNDWDWDEEIRKRDPNKPHIIHRDEYFGEETDYRQTSLTYYEGDDVLCDEESVPIYNAKDVAGELIFGHGSHDQNVVYVRNDQLQAEYEILKSTGHYQIEVLGADIEDALDEEENGLAHSVRKFKLD